MSAAFTAARSIGGMRVESHPVCILCGSGGTLLYETLTDHQYGVAGEWSLRRCRNPDCGLVWQDPMIIEDDLAQAYKTYYTHAGHGSLGSAGAWSRIFEFLDWRIASLQGLMGERARFTNGFLDDLLPGALLDVGCGNGNFAARMNGCGWSVRGTDFDPGAAREAARTHGFPVDVGDLQSLAYPDGAMDAVTARHVIEHIRHPRMFLQECWRILKPGGRLVLVTPNVASLGHQIYGAHWQGLEPPRHLFLYDAQTLHSLAAASDVLPASVFSTAQGASYIFRTSERIRTGTYDAAQSWPRTLMKYWIWQFQEVWKLRHGQSECGEELVLIADKPAAGQSSARHTPAPQSQSLSVRSGQYPIAARAVQC